MIFYILFFFGIIKSQENYSYQKPPTEILELVDITLPPRVLIDENKNFMIYLYRNSYKSIDELSSPEIKLAGLRLNPNSNSRSRINYYNNIMISKMDQIDKSAKQIKGLPKNPKLANIKWSPDQTKIAMTNTKEEGVELSSDEKVIYESKKGEYPFSGFLILYCWAIARVLSARTSNIKYFGSFICLNSFTIGIEASNRSPEKPAPQPKNTFFCIVIF